MSKTEKKRKIATQNYFIAIGIVILSVMLILFARQIYKDYQAYELKTPILSGHVAEISILEIDNYIRDKADVILYFGVSDDKNSREIEKKLLKLIQKDKLEDELIYLNLTNEADIEGFIRKFNKKYLEDEKDEIVTYPAVVIISERKVSATASKRNGYLKFSEVEKIFEEQELYQ